MLQSETIYNKPSFVRMVRVLWFNKPHLLLCALAGAVGVLLTRGNCWEMSLAEERGDGAGIRDAKLDECIKCAHFSQGFAYKVI